ncbi:hypothetical protein DN730_10955 [Marinomonas piezotolerans]|uniref:Uncharacterized protein n=1 Tax=Marinomonas piezotolerans TaxID=2213058 RepID=A0A370U8P3_9GAMM|nr:hypothetical protein DN730_10955 [Marinomonas piezotolerans]
MIRAARMLTDLHGDIVIVCIHSKIRVKTLEPDSGRSIKNVPKYFFLRGGLIVVLEFKISF